MSKLKKFSVTLFYSGFCSYEVEAYDKEEAFKKAKIFGLDKDEVLSNLEPLEYLDCVEEI